MWIWAQKKVQKKSQKCAATKISPRKMSISKILGFRKKTDAKKVWTKILGFRKKHEIVNPGGLPEMRRHEKWAYPKF